MAKLKEDLRETTADRSEGSATDEKRPSRSRFETDVQMGHFFAAESSSHLTMPCSATAIWVRSQPIPDDYSSRDASSLLFASALAGAAELVDTVRSLSPRHRSPGFRRLSKSSEKADEDRFG